MWNLETSHNQCSYKLSMCVLCPYMYINCSCVTIKPVNAGTNVHTCTCIIMYVHERVLVHVAYDWNVKHVDKHSLTSFPLKWIVLRTVGLSGSWNIRWPPAQPTFHTTDSCTALIHISYLITTDIRVEFDLKNCLPFCTTFIRYMSVFWQTDSRRRALKLGWRSRAPTTRRLFCSNRVSRSGKHLLVAPL